MALAQMGFARSITASKYVELSLRWHILPSNGNFRAPLHPPLARSIARFERLVEMVASVWQWLGISLGAVYFLGTVALSAGLSQRVM